jgi:HK97 family phage portal protein
VDYADPALRYLYGGVSGTSSGERVDVERAAGLPTVWRCVSLIAGTIGSLPLTLYRRGDDGSREKHVTHPLYSVLHDRPSPYMSSMTFFEALTTSVLLYGNGYAAVTKDDDGRTRALWFIHPDRVHVEPLKTGRLRYRVSNPDGSQTLISDMCHVVGPLSADGITGRSVISSLRETLGSALAAERYSGETFANGLAPRGTLTTANRLSKDSREHLKESLEDKHTGRGKRHKTLILEEGLRFEAMSIDHESAQLIESRRFSVEDVARAFGVPLHLVGSPDKSTVYSNASQEGMHYLKFCLAPWLARIESAITLACIPSLERGRAYVEFNVDSLLSVDTKTRFETYSIALASGVLTVPEVRARENLPALPAGSAVPQTNRTEDDE